MGSRPARELVRVALACDVDAPRLARDAVRDVPELARILDDVLVVVSELVTNAVMHSGCAPQETLMLRVVINDAHIRIAVHDPGYSAATPATVEHPPPGGGGLGLRIVAGFTARWGTDQPDGRLVWAEVAKPCQRN